MVTAKEVQADLLAVEAQLDQYRPITREFQEIKLRQGDAQEKVLHLNKLIKDRKNWSVFLAELSSQIPEGIWINKIHLYHIAEEALDEEERPVPPPNSLLIRGSSEGVENIGKLIFALNQLRELSSIKLDEIKEVSSGDYSYTITASIGVGGGN
ncbi:hypothetical protein N752_13255 [Desulforamulus aquiferis]|nr:PilN domain-containing protein [Desulforamulus aquiferis]RYD04335.1 hypothetical protein N752_13255 [Desulforamulus aquiferis]